MESEGYGATSADDLLAAHERATERARDRRVPREAAYFSLWLGILTTAYLTIFLITFDASEDVNPTFIMVVPVIVGSLAANGALERFGIRLRTRPSAWIAFVAAALLFLAFLVLTITGTPYPWWWRLLLPVIVLVAFGALTVPMFKRSARQIHRARATSRLSLGARVSTSLIGGVLGLLIATCTLPYASVVSSFIAMVPLFASLITLRTRFGLPNAGFEWGRAHWIGFTCAVTICFGAVLLTVYVHWFTLPAAILLGVLTLSAMLVPACVSRGAR